MYKYDNTEPSDIEVKENTKIFYMSNIEFYDTTGEKKEVKNINMPYNLEYFVLHEKDSTEKDAGNKYGNKKKDRIEYFTHYINKVLSKFKIPFNCKVLFYGIYFYHGKFYEINYFSEIKPQLYITKCDFFIMDKSIHTLLTKISTDVKTQVDLIKLYCKRRSRHILLKIHNDKLLIKISQDIAVIKTNIERKENIIKNNVIIDINIDAKKEI
jgi:hypothetical protein